MNELRLPGHGPDNLHNQKFLSEIEVRDPDLVVVTADHADARVSASVQEVLRLLRDVKGIDVVFVGDMTECGRHVAYGSASEDAEDQLSSSTDSLEALWGERVIESRARQAADASGGPLRPVGDAGRHIHSRIVSESGEVYGMLCCISPHDDTLGFRIDQRLLRHTAALTAKKIDRSLRPA